ncbi:hypothetical protein NLM16_16670 [Bradyrhizobium brasilense]|uniref:hypothetical protein n=1 Tax=Bradyrhizobium brasilense TaxID=1419277 RepID=UPI002877A613|nr:hypothetical protein [Bradyrhizobium brasilense]MCP3415734.1 hypothetical protein [Bradyrhizobium brasilense]
MDGKAGSSSDAARSLSEWTELLDRRGGAPAAAGRLSGYASADVSNDSSIRERFIADIMAPAARALLSADGAWYQIALPDRKAPKHQICRVLRVAVGLFRAAEAGAMHRVTAYHIDPWDWTYVTTEPDGLFSKQRDRILPWDGRSPSAGRPVKERLESVFSAVTEWAAANLPSLSETHTLTEWHAAQLEELKRLYDFFYSSKASLSPSRKNAQAGYFAGSSGYAEKLEEQVCRMMPVYRSFLLSVGEIRAPLPSKYKKDRGAAFLL